jgi:hypothetical protein
LKKSAQKTFSSGLGGASAPRPLDESFFASFCSQKEEACLP